MYEQIDVNGDGTMEWDELTRFVIEAGMTSGNQEAPKTYHRSVFKTYDNKIQT
jgi:hypothetical protein